MTKHIDDFLNIPHENNINETTNVVTTQENSVPSVLNKFDDTHSIESEEIRKRALELQEEIAEVARNVEPSKSARMFEVSGQHLKLALEAANSKEKRKIEVAKLKLDAARLKIDDEAVNSLNNGAVVIADRNNLIKQLMAEDEVIDVKIDDNEKNSIT